MERDPPFLAGNNCCFRGQIQGDGTVLFQFWSGLLAYPEVPASLLNCCTINTILAPGKGMLANDFLFAIRA